MLKDPSVLQNSKGLRIFMSEVLGMMILITVGLGGICQVEIGRKFIGMNTSTPDAEGLDPTNHFYLYYGDLLTIGMCFGFAVVMAVTVSVGASGAHLNPALSFACACLGEYSWYYFPIYVTGQYLGAFIGGTLLLVVHNTTLRKIAEKMGDKAVKGAFSTYPMSDWVTTGTTIFDQFWGTATLAIVIGAVGDKRNWLASAGHSLAPIAAGWAVLAIVVATVLNCGTAINPARDFPTRLVSYLAGYEDVFPTFTLIPLFVTQLGALFGAVLYRLAVGWFWPPLEEKEKSVELKLLEQLEDEVDDIGNYLRNVFSMTQLAENEDDSAVHPLGVDVETEPGYGVQYGGPGFTDDEEGIPPTPPRTRKYRY